VPLPWFLPLTPSPYVQKGVFGCVCALGVPYHPLWQLEPLDTHYEKTRSTPLYGMRATERHDDTKLTVSGFVCVHHIGVPYHPLWQLVPALEPLYTHYEKNYDAVSDNGFLVWDACLRVLAWFGGAFLSE
jgi:hypothetical protein